MLLRFSRLQSGFRFIQSRLWPYPLAYLLFVKRMSSPPTTAFVLGAGLGTRLKALTSKIPKPLIPVCNQPLITRALGHLQAGGVHRFVINTHWKAEAYSRVFPSGAWSGCSLHFSHESPEVLETAGGLKFAESLLPKDESIWVYNGDILSDLPLQRAWEAHVAAGNEVTLVLRTKDGPLQVLFDAASGRVADIGRRLFAEQTPAHLFTGIYLVEPSFLRRIPPRTKISVIPLFIEMIREGAKLGGVVIDEGDWWDLGTREQYLAVHQSLAHQSAPWIDKKASISSSTRLIGACAIGAHAEVAAGAILEDTLVWPNARIAAGSHLIRCIVTEGASASGVHTDLDFS